MKIFVDADACPVVREVEAVARKRQVPVMLFCDTNHVLRSDYSEVKTVGAGADAVDFALINLCREGDLVITQDYGLAAMALSRRAYAMHCRGWRYTEENIDRLLAERHAVKTLRRVVPHSRQLRGLRRCMEGDGKSFYHKLDEFVAWILREGSHMDKVGELQRILRESKNIVFFGGAGMSTESGVPDFRSANGIYSQKLHQEFRPEEMASHNFLVNHTEAFFEFYREHRIFRDIKPNAGHLALAELERRGILKAVVTQNIDGLHQLAGSENVCELHGSILRWPCVQCGRVYPVDYALREENKPIPYCEDCGGIVRPGVVLYGEGLDSGVVERAVSAIRQADTLIVGGTSLVVYPAAGLIDYFQGQHLILMNKTETKADARAELVIREPIGETLSRAVASLDEKD